MALTSKNKERIDRLNFAKGGGFLDFITDRRKLVAADSKFLFVGLGGKGSNTVAGIKTGVYQKIICDENLKRPENFEYLVIDADIENMDNLMRGAFGEIGLSGSPADAEICQLYDRTAAERLSPSKRHEIQENITEWINPTMNQELQGKGAGGIRQAGRYLLFGDMAFQKVKNTLYHKLRWLHGQITNTATQDLIVYIFAGVGGGTGSGIVIDIPYIIREICRQHNWKIKIYSYIFLPDTYSEEARNHSHVKYNSYAALKEIDTLMNIGQMDGVAHFRAKYAADFVVDSTERIFDSCVLVSGKRIDGMVLHPDRFSRKVVVDNIINLVTQNVTDKGFLANSFLDNSATMIQNAVRKLPETSVPRNAYYQYTVIGTGTLVLPIEQILAYIAHGTMDILAGAWDRHAQQTDVEDLLAKIPMKPQELAGAIIEKSDVPLLRYAAGIGGKVDKMQVIDDTLFNIIRQYWLKRNVDLYDAWDKAKNIYLEFIIRQVRESYYAAFKDEEKGIYFLKELLSSRVIEGERFNGVYQRISEEYMTSIAGLIGGERERQNVINQRIDEIKRELEFPVSLFKGRLIEEYRELCVDKLVCENRVYMYDELVRDCLKQIRGFLQARMDELQTYIDIFAYMREIVDQNYQSVMAGTMPQVEYAGKLVDFSHTNDEATQQIINYMDSMLASKKPGGVVTELEELILNTEDKWRSSEETFNPISVFVSFLEKEYEEIPNLTIEKFIKLKYGENGFDIGMQNICQELKNKAEIIFPADTIISLQSLASKTYVVVPAGAVDIAKNMNAFAETYGAEVAQSNDMDSMFWYNMVIGVPIFLLRDIKEYEELYEKNNIAGMHCWDSPTANWKDWPTLNNQALWSMPDLNIRERKFAEKVQEDVEKYLACGLIWMEERTKLYSAWCMPVDNSRVTKDTILDWCKEDYLKAPIYDEEGNVETGEAFTRVLVSKHNFNQYQVQIPTVYMDNVTRDSLYKLIRMNIFLYHRLQDTYVVYTACRKMIEKENGNQLKVKNMQRFYDYVRTGIIQITEDAVFLVHEDGEEEEIMYFEEYSVLENQFYIYYAFNNFMVKYEEEQLEEIDRYRKELSDDRTEAVREKYRELSENFIEICTKMRDTLKRLDTKKMLEKAGQANMISIYGEFFDTFIGMKKGK